MDGELAGPAAAARRHAQRRALAGRWGSPRRGAKARAAGDGQPAAPSARDRAVRTALPGRGERGALTLRSGGNEDGAPGQLTLPRSLAHFAPARYQLFFEVLAKKVEMTLVTFSPPHFGQRVSPASCSAIDCVSSKLVPHCSQ